MDDIEQNVADVRENLARASAEWGKTPEIIAVSKTIEPDRINRVRQTGITQLGENRVQEILEKYPFLDASFAIHQIGQLQTNKVKYIIDKVCMIQSLDRENLAQEINRRAQETQRRMPVLVQVNIGREPQKGGMEIEEVLPFVRAYAKLPGLCIEGLMAVMPNTRDETVLRPLFRRMRALFEALRGEAIDGTQIRHLSMGMSSDYEIAAQEGATMVRVGTAIFGKRTYPAQTNRI